MEIKPQEEVMRAVEQEEAKEKEEITRDPTGNFPLLV